MKAVLLLGFLALGPALADQTPVAPVFYGAVATAPAASPLRVHPADRIAAQVPMSADDRARLCGGGS
jgi:hypothetical protein